jgi:hypothetical protein
MNAQPWDSAVDNQRLASWFVVSYAGGKPGKDENRFGPLRYPIPEGIQIRKGGERHLVPRELVEENREDYEQAALIGLYRAAEKGNDPAKGEFSTFAAPYVFDELNKVTRSLRNARDRSLDEGLDQDEGLDKKAARKRLSEGDHVPSAEDQSLGKLGTEHSYTKSRSSVGDDPTASPSAPDAGVTEAGERFTDAEQNRDGKERSSKALNRPSPSARHPKAGCDLSFRELLAEAEATALSRRAEAQRSLRRAAALLEEPTPEHLAEAAAILKSLDSYIGLQEQIVREHSLYQAQLLLGNITRRHPDPEVRRAGEALAKYARRSIDQAKLRERGN